VSEERHEPYSRHEGRAQPPATSTSCPSDAGVAGDPETCCVCRCGVGRWRCRAQARHRHGVAPDPGVRSSAEAR